MFTTTSEIASLAFGRFSRLSASTRAAEIALEAAEEACTVHPRRCTCPATVALKAKVASLNEDLIAARASWAEAGEIRRGA